jgi:hypothetical protein
MTEVGSRLSRRAALAATLALPAVTVAASDGARGAEHDPSFAAFNRYQAARAIVNANRDMADDDPAWLAMDAAEVNWYRTPATTPAGILRRVRHMLDLPADGALRVTGGIDDRANYALLRDLGRLAGEPPPRVKRVRISRWEGDEAPPWPAEPLTRPDFTEDEVREMNGLFERISAIHAQADARGVFVTIGEAGGANATSKV